jgi:serine/threonine protein phosphatase PrpC
MRSAEHRVRALTFASATDIGTGRERNEDTILEAPDLGLFGVFDGCGGHAAGDVASQAAARVVRRAVATQGPDRRDLAAALHEADSELHTLGSRDPPLRGLATTAVVLAFSPALRFVRLAWCGDSRAYFFRPSPPPIFQPAIFHRMTIDHSMRMAGRSVLSHCIGGNGRNCQVDQDRIGVDAGDVFVLCSDGAYDVPDFDKSAPLALMRAPLSLKEKAQAIVDYALKSGSQDNVSVLLARVER